MKRMHLLIALVLAMPAALSAQSLFGTQGLGSPIPGLDARARALGSNGVGLIGLNTSMMNPADHAGLFRRGFSASFQPWSGSVNLNGEDGDIGGTRFPVMQLFYPAGRFTFALGYAGMLDQSWAIIAEGEEVLGGETIPISDVVRSTGGLGEVKFGAGYYASDKLAFGASVGMHTGNLHRSIRREYSDSSGFLPFTRLQSWEYSGPTASLGVRWNPITQLRIGASLSFSGNLEAEPDSISSGTYSYDMPWRLNAGVSAQLAPRLLATVSGGTTNWGGGDFAAPGTNSLTFARPTRDIGGGLEWSGLRAGDRIFPLRVGVRSSQLPFHAPAETKAKELTYSAGLGLQLAGDEFGPLAMADIGLERGKRDGWESLENPDGLSEKFWRVTVSLSLFGR